jgi:hypothetical protein
MTRLLGCSLASSRSHQLGLMVKLCPVLYHSARGGPVEVPEGAEPGSMRLIGLSEGSEPVRVGDRTAPHLLLSPRRVTIGSDAIGHNIRPFIVPLEPWETALKLSPTAPSAPAEGGVFSTLLTRPRPGASVGSPYASSRRYFPEGGRSESPCIWVTSSELRTIL